MENFDCFWCKHPVAAGEHGGVYDAMFAAYVHSCRMDCIEHLSRDIAFLRSVEEVDKDAIKDMKLRRKLLRFTKGKATWNLFTDSAPIHYGWYIVYQPPTGYIGEALYDPRLKKWFKFSVNKEAPMLPAPKIWLLIRDRTEELDEYMRTAAPPHPHEDITP